MSIDYSKFHLLQTEPLVVLKHYQTCYKHYYYIVDEASGKRVRVEKEDYIAMRRFLDNKEDLPDELVEKLEKLGIDPYSPDVVPTYESEIIAHIYLAQRATGGMYNTMLLISKRKLAGEIEISMINAREDDPELAEVLSALHSSTARAILRDFPVLKGFAKVEKQLLKEQLEERGFNEETIDAVLAAIRDLRDLGGKQAIRKLTKLGIVKYEAPAIPEKYLGELINVDPSVLIRDALTPQARVDPRLFDFYSTLFIRPEGPRPYRLARYNPNAISLINSGCGRTTMALNLQRAGFAILEDKRTVAGELGFASVEEARKGLLHDYVGTVVLDEVQEYEGDILRHMMNLIELGEARITQAGVSLRIRTNATFVLHGNVPAISPSIEKMQIIMLRMLQKMSDNTYAIGRRFPILFFGQSYRTIRWREDRLSDLDHDKALALISEYIRLRQPMIDALFRARGVQDWLNKRLPKEYISDVREIADSISDSSASGGIAVVSNYILGQEEGYPKLRGLALRLAIRDHLGEMLMYDGSGELERKILSSAEAWLNRILLNNLESFSNLASGINLAFKAYVESEDALKALPVMYKDIIRMLRRERESCVLVEELIEKRHHEAGCETPKKELKRYFTSRVKTTTANKKLRPFGWELVDTEHGRAFIRLF